MGICNSFHITLIVSPSETSILTSYNKTEFQILIAKLNDVNKSNDRLYFGCINIVYFSRLVKKMNDIFCLHTDFDNILFSHSMHIDIHRLCHKKKMAYLIITKPKKLLALIPAFKD